MLKQYGILEKMPSGLDNVTVYCGDERLIKKRGLDIPIVTVEIRNYLEFRKLAKKLGACVNSFKRFGIEIPTKYLQLKNF